MPDPVEELAVLRERSDVLLQQAESARTRITDTRAADGSGQVVVELDAEGAVRSVRVGLGWDHHLTPAELPSAVLEALAAARTTRLEQYADSLAAVQAEPAPRARPAAAPRLVDAFRERVEARDGDPRAAGELVEELLEQVRDGLDQANRLLDEHAAGRHTARSRQGHVSASVGGGDDLLSLDLEPGWLRTAHPTNIGREITEAIQAAAARARREGVAAALRATRLTEVARLLLDA